MVIPHTVTPSRVDPPESLMSLEDDPDYQEVEVCCGAGNRRRVGNIQLRVMTLHALNSSWTSADSQHSLETGMTSYLMTYQD